MQGVGMYREIDINSLGAVTSIVGMDVSPFAVVGGNNVLRDIVVAVEFAVTIV
jgi:hypothetical protein